MRPQRTPCVMAALRLFWGQQSRAARRSLYAASGEARHGTPNHRQRQAFTMEITFRLNGETVTTIPPADDHPAGLAAHRARADRHQGRLQRRRLRRLHGDGHRRRRHPPSTPASCSCRNLHGKAVRTVEGLVRARRKPAPRSAGDDRPSRQPVRLLHAGLRRVDGGGASERRHRPRRCAGRQPVPLHRLRAHRARRRGGRACARARVDARHPRPRRPTRVPKAKGRQRRPTSTTLRDGTRPIPTPRWLPGRPTSGSG